MPKHSRKDYEMVASLIAGWAEVDIGQSRSLNRHGLTLHQIMVRDAVKVFEADNPRFKPRLFARAAGLSEFSIGLLWPKEGRDAANINTKARKAA